MKQGWANRKFHENERVGYADSIETEAVCDYKLPSPQLNTDLDGMGPGSPVGSQVSIAYRPLSVALRGAQSERARLPHLDHDPVAREARLVAYSQRALSVRARWWEENSDLPGLTEDDKW